jgi:hypothetical protein
MIAAVKYFVNIASYDLQFIGGMFREQPTLGVGWSGSIKDAGFKGEFQYYFRDQERRDQLNAVIEADYVFGNGWYLGAGSLYNSQGTTEPISLWEISSFRFSPQQLMPTKWNFMLSSGKEITPLFSLTATFVYAPMTNLLFVLPSFTYGLSSNVDLSFVWQSYFGEKPYGFDDVGHQCFLRLKWSF